MKFKKNQVLHIGLLAAMPEELGNLLGSLIEIRHLNYGDFDLYSGKLQLKNNNFILITAAWSGWGKVSAARAATRIIATKYKDMQIDFLLFSGVAGAVSQELQQWDIIISDKVMQHDMDARPLFEKFVVPSIKEKEIYADKNLLEIFHKSLKQINKIEYLYNFGNIYRGLIATGDMFISDKKKLSKLKKEIPSLLAVEMEGAAVAQVAYQENIPWIIIRTISDEADDNAENDFNDFLKKYKTLSWALIRYILEDISY